MSSVPLGFNFLAIGLRNHFSRFVKDTADGTPAARTTLTCAMEAPSSPPPLRIFLVENHLATVRYLQLHLESEGHTVRHAGTVASALEAIPATPCDLLISDMGLPDGDGWTLLNTLRQNGSAPPFAVAISGYGTAADRKKSANAGFRHHLLKPFDPDELDEILHTIARELPPGPASPRATG